jgi:hypothetical protein
MSVNRALTWEASGMGDLVSSSNITGTKPVRITDPACLPGLFRARCCVQASVQGAIWVPEAGGDGQIGVHIAPGSILLFHNGTTNERERGQLSLVGRAIVDRVY